MTIAVRSSLRSHTALAALLLCAASGNAQTVPAIVAVGTSTAAFVGAIPAGPVDTPVRIASFGAYQAQFGGLSDSSDVGYAVQQFFANGGTSAWVVRSGPKGLHALDAAAELNILCLPGETSPPALKAAATYCEQRGAFLIIDPPAGKSPSDMASLAGDGSLPRSSFAALYYPWLRISDAAAGGQPRLVPPSGTIAGLFARTDKTLGVWKSPAGTAATLNAVLGLEAAVTDADGGTLNAAGVNCFRTFPGRGIVCWGARTLDTTGDYKYVATRRLATMVEQSVRNGTTWAHTRANDAALWADLRRVTSDFLIGLWRQGALLGSKPDQAYFVQCGRGTTMTQADLNNGVVNILVGIAPIRPAEFVVLRIQQIVGGTAPVRHPVGPKQRVLQRLPQ